MRLFTLENEKYSYFVVFYIDSREDLYRIAKRFDQLRIDRQS
jgi:hypothetical protein